MSKRLALLIGVSEYDKDAIPDLPVVHNDIRDLASVLERSNYEVRRVGAGGGDPATRNHTRGAIEDALSDAETGDTLLVYFSGHGAHYDGKDWLVPSDGRITGPKFHDYLVHLDFASFVENSKAGAVIFFIDACREGVELGEKSMLSMQQWGEEKRTHVKNRRFAMVFGCRQGDVCRYVDNGESFSLFTRALTSALDPSTQAKTLGQVLDAVDGELKQLCKEHYPNQTPQRVRFSRETDAASDEEIRSCVICDGTILGRRPGDREDFRDPTDTQAFLAYYHEIARWHGYIRFLGLPHLRDNPDVPIDRLYVEPAISDTHIQPDQPTDGWPETTPVLQAVADLRRLVLLGEPGSGKSTLVSWIAWQLTQPGDNAWTKRLGRLVPLPMILRDMDIGADITWEGLLDAFLALPVAKPLHEDGKGRERLDDLLERGQAFIILDGLDEIGSTDVRNRLKKAVFDGFKQCQSCRWLLTSRIVGHDEVPFDRETNLVKRWREQKGGGKDEELVEMPTKKAHRRYVAPFSDEQIEQFARNWYIQHEQAEHERRQRARELVGAIASNESTQHLARIPNLLTLIALIYRVYRWLPHGRAMLYDRIAEAYLESIDRFRGLDGLDYSLAQKKGWLAYVGFKMQQRRGQEQENELKLRDPSESQQREILVEERQVHAWIAEAMGASVENPEASAELFVDYIARRSGLLLPRGEDRFGFMHLSFQEFFAACYLAKHVTTPAWVRGKKTPPGTTAENLRAYADLFVWRETLVLLFESLADDSEWIVCMTEALFGEDFDRWGAPAAPRDATAAALLAELAVDRYTGLPDERRRRAMECCWDWELAIQASDAWKERPWQVYRLSVAPVLLGAKGVYADDSWEALKQAWERRDASALTLADCTSECDLSHLSGLAGLQSLDLRHTQISDAGLSHLSGLAGLQSLGLYGCTQISDAGLSHLSGLSGLQSLSLGYTQISDAGLTHLVKCRKLSDLQTEGTKVTQAGLKRFHAARKAGKDM